YCLPQDRCLVVCHVETRVQQRHLSVEGKGCWRPWTRLAKYSLSRCRMTPSSIWLRFLNQREPKQPLRPGQAFFVAFCVASRNTLPVALLYCAHDLYRAVVWTPILQVKTPQYDLTESHSRSKRLLWKQLRVTVSYRVFQGRLVGC